MQSSEIALLENRENMYRLLARLYRSEVDAGLLATLQTLTFPEKVENDLLSSGYRRFAEYLAEPGADPLTDLAVDYARVFLAAGVAKGVMAIPCESVYTSREHLLMQDAWEAVRKIYAEHGIGKTVDDGLYEDHIALELDFMAHLTALAETAAKANDIRQLAELLAQARQFLKNHLLNWIAPFAADVRKTATSSFYLALVDMTEGFLNIEDELLKTYTADYHA